MIRHDDLALLGSIKRHEGYRSRAYRDSLGILTIGYGTNLESGVTEREAALVLEERVRSTIERLSGLPWYVLLSPARQRVIVEMSYQLGHGGLLNFRRMLAAIGRGDWEAAADEMLDSRWAAQTPERARELSDRFRDRGADAPTSPYGPVGGDFYSTPSRRGRGGLLRARLTPW